MKWLFIPAAAAMSLAVAMPVWAAPDAGTAQAATHQMFAANRDRGGDNKDNQRPNNARDTKRGPAAQEAPKAASHDVQQNRRAQQNQRQQNQRQQNAVRTNQQQQNRQLMQRQQYQRQQNAVRTNQQQQNRQLMQRQQNQRQQNAVRSNQQQQNRQLMQRQQNQRQQAQRQRYNWRDYRPGHRPADWNNHRNFDRGVWQQNRQAQQRFHWNNYRRPSGWYYRRWTFGMILPSLFWSRDYWIESYWNYGLMDPPYGYVWVRYGDDAMLVNVESGDILRVEYGLFY